MVLIKRVMLAAAMSLLSEGAIAGGMPVAPSDKAPPLERAQDGDCTAPGDAGLDATC